MFVFPLGEWVLDETGIVVTWVASDLLADKRWRWEGCLLAWELNLRDDESVVVACETVYFPLEPLMVEFVSCLLDNRLLTDAAEHAFCLFHRYAVFPFITREADGCVFDGEVGGVVVDTHSYHPVVFGTDISLNDAVGNGLLFETHVVDNEFPFNLLGHIGVLGFLTRKGSIFLSNSCLARQFLELLFAVG